MPVVRGNSDIGINVKVLPSRLPTFYLSHGGGRWPYMTGAHRQLFAKLEMSLNNLPGVQG